MRVMTAPVPDAPTDTPAAGRGSDAPSLPHQIKQHAQQLAEPIKPKLRGWLHLGMFPAALIAGLVLTALADSTRGRIACGIYALTACLLFGVSALYHRHTWQSSTARVWMKRLDHSMIFLFIAGTYTPFSFLLLPRSTAVWILGVVWGGAIA